MLRKPPVFKPTKTFGFCHATKNLRFFERVKNLQFFSIFPFYEQFIEGNLTYKDF